MYKHIMTLGWGVYYFKPKNTMYKHIMSVTLGYPPLWVKKLHVTYHVS